MKVTVIPIIIGAVGTVTKGLVQGLKEMEIRGQVEAIQSPALLRSVRIESRRLGKTCCHLDFNGKPSANTGVKKSQKSKIRIIMMITINNKEIRKRTKKVLMRL